MERDDIIEYSLDAHHSEEHGRQVRKTIWRITLLLAVVTTTLSILAAVFTPREVALEQVLAWNPQVIFVQDRYPQVVTQIQNDPNWQGIDAVKNHRVWLMPEYAKA